LRLKVDGLPPVTYGKVTKEAAIKNYRKACVWENACQRLHL